MNLAGANVAEGRWTGARKEALLASRLDSLALLHRELARPGQRVRAMVSASAIGLYGDSGDQVATEDTPPVGHDFLADMTGAWEQGAAPVGELGIRVATPRIGIVLTTRGGALSALASTVKLGLGAPIGSGRQYLSWIHGDSRSSTRCSARLSRICTQRNRECKRRAPMPEMALLSRTSASCGLTRPRTRK